MCVCISKEQLAYHSFTQEPNREKVKITTTVPPALKRPCLFSMTLPRGLMRDRGIAGLYAGVGVTLVEIIPASAIQFGSYAMLKVRQCRLYR